MGKEHVARVKPWQRIQFAYPDIPTMISVEERRYLYWLSSHVWTGEGHIVEMGPWLGGSTYCLAAGMSQNPPSTKHRLHVFDNFIWREFMSGRAPIFLDDGDSFRPYYEENVKELNERIVTHQKSLPDDEIASDQAASKIRHVAPEASRLVTWDLDEPVEILFIDGAKSWSGLQFLLSEFAGHLIPEKSLLVCQDYKYWGTYWVPMMMEMLQEHLELVHNLAFNTVTLRLISPLDKQQIHSLGSFGDIGIEEGLTCLDSASSRLSASGDRLGSAILQACAIRFLCHKGELEEALDAYRRAESDWPFGKNDSNLQRARQWLEDQLGMRIDVALHHRLERLAIRSWQAGWKTGRRLLKNRLSD